MLRSIKVCISCIGFFSQIIFPFHRLVTLDLQFVIQCVSCCLINESAETNCLVLGGVPDDPDAEMRKAR